MPPVADSESSPNVPGSSRQAPVGYRPDIDGLRALAVLAVIGFHASPRFVPGGFVGVDVFFVISGYLISGIILRQLERGRFSFADFYARRIRRIFPALIVVLIGCTAMGWVVLTGAEFRQLHKHIAAGALYVSNFALWGEAGYFDVQSEAKPLLHLWSLAIEEQFYLVWPPLLFLAWRRGLNVQSLILLIIASSFALNIVLTAGTAVSAFYLPVTRMWELLLGGLFAWIEMFRQQAVNRSVNRIVFVSPERADDRLIANAKAGIGIALILLAATMLGKSAEYPGWWFASTDLRRFAAVIGVDGGTVYPGWWAILPTIGTALVIWAGAAAWVNRVLLSRRAVVYVGLMSYPLYLWHWPLLSFLHVTENGNPSRMLKLAAIALSFVLAAMTYELIERPVRRTMSVRTPRRIVAMAVVLLAIGGASLVAFATGRWSSRAPYFPTDEAVGERSPRHDVTCAARFPTEGEYCQQFDESLPVTTALVGDSHAEHFFAGVGSALRARGEGLVHLGQSGCPPLLGIAKTRAGLTDECNPATRSVIKLLVDTPGITRVVVSFRGAYYVTGAVVGSFEVLPNISFRLAGTDLSPEESIAKALADTVATLETAGKSVWILQQVPEHDFPVAECVGRPFSFAGRVRTPCGTSRAAVDQRQALYRRILQGLINSTPTVRVFDPMPYLCDESMCYASRNGLLFYIDNSHLGREGSLFFADKFGFEPPVLAESPSRRP